MHDTQDARHVGPTQPFSDELHQQKYRSEGESFREAMNRVAAGLKDDDTGKAQEEAASCTIDPETGRRSCE